MISEYGMNQDELKESIPISVLITAYDRREFIMEALKSVVNQNLDRSLYEIVVVKNFSDRVVDGYISEIGAKSVLSVSSKMGKFICDALPVCSGNVIAFLEDDDWWSNDRLSIIYNAFTTNEKLGYYHNSVISVDTNGDALENVKLFENGKEIEKVGTFIIRDKEKISSMKRIGRMFPDFNSSSIAIRKKVIANVIEKLREIDTAPDTFMFYASLVSDFSIMLDSNKGTYYRHHKKNMSGSYERDTEAKLQNLSIFTDRAIQSYGIILRMVSESQRTEFEVYANRRIVFTKILNHIQRKEIIRRGMVKLVISFLRYLTIYDRILNFEALFLSSVYCLSPSCSKKLLLRYL